MTYAWRRRLLFLAGHRSMREADFLVKPFSERVLEACSTLDDQDSETCLVALDRFLREEDAVLVSYLSGMTPWPQIFSCLQRFVGEESKGKD